MRCIDLAMGKHLMEEIHSGQCGIHAASRTLVGKAFRARFLSETIIRGTLKTPNSQLVTPISTKLQRPDECD
jgi:hypothetical protein